jgi:hypothetical protein
LPQPPPLVIELAMNKLETIKLYRRSELAEKLGYVKVEAS